MAVISDAIIGGIAWEAFSKSLSFYAEGANDFVLRVYLAQQLRALEGISDKQIEETADIIEATIMDAPEEIKNISDAKEKEKVFKEYVKKNTYINNGTLQGVQHNEGTITMHFGDVIHNPK